MVSVAKITFVGSKPILELVALTTDTLPTGDTGDYKIYNGSSVIFMDNPSMSALYDEENAVWRSLIDGSVM